MMQEVVKGTIIVTVTVKGTIKLARGKRNNDVSIQFILERGQSNYQNVKGTMIQRNNYISKRQREL